MPCDLRRGVRGLQFEFIHGVVKLVVFIVVFVTGHPRLNYGVGLLIQLRLDGLCRRLFNRIVGLLNRIAFGLRTVLLSRILSASSRRLSD